MSPSDKALVWLHGEIKTPPLSKAARIEAGYLLRLLQKGQVLVMPHSRPSPSWGRVATNCASGTRRPTGGSDDQDDTETSR